MEKKIEINVRGTDYSVVCTMKKDYSKRIKTSCINCGRKVTYNPVEVELKELYNAHKMVTILIKSPRAREVAKKIKEMFNKSRRICKECFLNIFLK